MAWRRAFWPFTAANTVLRLLLAALVPLGDDEGYYWVWSRHLATGYFDHPPLVAWLVALSTRLLGVSCFSIRLPFVLIGTATALALRDLVTAVTGDRWLADRSALLFQIVPVFFAIALLVIPDSPLLLFWLLTARLAWGASRSRAMGPWLSTGLALGGALISKYVGVLLVPSLLAAIPAERRRGALLGLGIAAVAALLVFAPVIAWNAGHGWASLRYQFISRHHASGVDAARFASFLGSQVLYLSPVGFLLACCAALRIGPWKFGSVDPAKRFLWWLAVPTLALFLIASTVTRFKPNWPSAGYLTMLPLLLMGLDRLRERRPEATAWIGGSAVALSLIFTALPIAHAIRPFMPFPQGADPTADMRGWGETVASARQAFTELASTAPGARPFFAAGRYQVASRLEFYLPGHPSVVCLNPGRDAYDDWQKLEELEGRDFVFVATQRFPSLPERRVELRSSRVFARIVAMAGPSAVHVLTIYQCRGFVATRLRGR